MSSHMKNVTQNSFRTRFGYPESQRKGPNEEQMHRESLRFKRDTNNFKLENIQLKTRIQQFEKEIEKKNKLIKSIMEQINNTQEGILPKNYFDTETSTVLNLKKHIKKLKEEVKSKDDIINNLGNDVRNESTEEIELRIKLSMEECRNIKNDLKNVRENPSGTESYLKNIKQIEEKLQDQAMILSNLRKEKEQIEALIASKNEDIINMQERINKMEIQRKKFIRENREFTKNKIRLLNEKKVRDKLKQQID